MAPPAALLGSVETTPSPARAYSVVLFGATGFTGQLCANYLSEDQYVLAASLVVADHP